MATPDGEHTHEPDPQGPHRHVILEAAIVGLANSVRELAMTIPSEDQVTNRKLGRVLRMLDAAVEEIEPRRRHLGG